MCEPDSEFSLRGYHFIDVDQLFSSTYYGETNQHDVDISQEQYVSDINQDAEFNSVEIDEIIARSLQEEFSHISLAEATELSNALEESCEESSGTQDSCTTPIRNYCAGHEDGLQGTDDMEPSTSCSSPVDLSYGGEDFSYTQEITDESELDGQVGQRLYEITPVPHVPRTNGDIPSIDEATSDHQRLLDRLQLYNLVECKVQGDGNCQFRALSDQFYRTPEHHKFVRRQVINQLKSHPEMYEGYVPMAYGDYLKKMSKSGEWGDHVTLQAAADSYGAKIFVLTSFKGTCSIEILPNVQKSKQVVSLSFWAEVHYNSIYPQEGVAELQPFNYKRKKRWWSFGNKH